MFYRKRIKNLENTIKNMTKINEKLVKDNTELEVYIKRKFADIENSLDVEIFKINNPNGNIYKVIEQRSDCYSTYKCVKYKYAYNNTINTITFNIDADKYSFITKNGRDYISFMEKDKNTIYLINKSDKTCVEVDFITDIDLKYKKIKQQVQKHYPITGIARCHYLAPALFDFD